MARSRDLDLPVGDAEHEDDDLGPPLRGVVEVDWDGWEEDGPRSRRPWIVSGVLLVLVAVVAVLVMRALSTEAELPALPAEAGGAIPAVATTDDAAPAPPTLEALAGLVPAGVEGCVPAPEQPTDGSVRMACPRPEAPELVTFTLFADERARDQAFDDAVTTLELDPASPGECALGEDAVHDFVGAQGRGRVACRRAEGHVDLVWTDVRAPVLATAGGFGSHLDHYRFWSQLVERRDDAFPLRPEQALLDEVPTELQSRCYRDLALLEQAAGRVAVTCTPPTGAAESLSWVRFADADTMAAWLDRAAYLLAGATADTGGSACAPDGAGPNESLPVPWYGTGTYDLEGTTGRVLCTVGEQGRNVLLWTRAGSLIGSVASSDAAIQGSMLELVEWWWGGGHRP